MISVSCTLKGFRRSNCLLKLAFFGFWFGSVQALPNGTEDPKGLVVAPLSNSELHMMHVSDKKVNDFTQESKADCLLGCRLLFARHI